MRSAVLALAASQVILPRIAHAQSANTPSKLDRSKQLTATTQTAASVRTQSEDTAVRPFNVSISEESLVDLRNRIAATRWPDRELVSDQSQGVQLATVQKLANYWQAEYDWRKCEAALNALPQFMTQIDGVDVHFIHVRANRDDALDRKSVV